ncbi:MAG: GIY-YIG nuclease family protein [Deltaproteobacteria bacterium]|nr:GIY-YIG nuclease family protein [Deltaproteobacteria bacterium]
MGRPATARRRWSVYLLRCGDGSLYTGVAVDVAARLAVHRAGRGAAYTRSHRPLELVHVEPGLTRSQALQREAAIKRLSRAAKERLVARRRSPGQRSGASRCATENSR